ncbi:MAK10-like protein [Tanacetum coccineum]
MALMYGLLKELTASRTPEKVLIREETRHPTTKNVNSISLIRIEEEKSIENNGETDKSAVEPRKSDEQEPPKEVHKTNEGGRRVDDEPAKVARENVTKNKKEEPAGVSSSHAKKITKKEDIWRNFEIPCNVGGLKHMNALVDQGSDVNVMPLSIYKRLIDERPAETDIRLSLASHSYIYPLGIAEDVLVDIAGYVYPVDFVILDIREDEKNTILGTPFLTTAKAVIKFDKGMITLKSRKSKTSFHRIPEPHCRIEKGIKNDIEPIAPTTTVNRLVLEWEEKIKLHQEKEMKFDQWKSKIFTLGWILEEIHVTWAHLEKKRTRLRLYTKSLEETIIQTVEMASPTLATTSQLDQDGFRSITMASECSRLK